MASPFAAASAQEVTGVLRAELTGAPSAGVVVTAVRSSDRTVVGRAMTADAGTFRLVVGVDSVVVLALRIGQQPVELWRGRLAAGERRDIGRALPDVPVAITTLRVRERARCGTAAAGDTSVTRTLFADALTALLASLSSTDGAAPRVRTVVVEQYRDLRGRVVQTSVPMRSVGATARPFRSVAVSALMRDGFVVTDRDGSSHYRAPDAQVLTSDAFLEQYCLSLDLSREPEGQVGIAFAPQRTRRTHVDVRGTLWLDLPTRTLRQLDFGYVGLAPVIASADPGGTVEYAHLADGRVIIDRWSLRMPTLAIEVATAPGNFARAPRTRVSGVQEVRGAVLESRLRRALLYSAGGERAERLLAGEPDSLPAPVLACNDTTPATAEVTGTVRRPDGTAVAGALVEAEWSAGLESSADGTPAWAMARAHATAGADGRFVLCGVPREQRVTLQARLDERRVVPTQLRVPEALPRGEVDLVLSLTGERR